MTSSLFVTFRQYSNVYIFCDCVNWLTSGCGQVSRFWEAVADWVGTQTSVSNRVELCCILNFFFLPLQFFIIFPLAWGESLSQKAWRKHLSCAACFAQENLWLFNRCDRRNLVEGAGNLMVWGFHFQFVIVFSLLFKFTGGQGNFTRPWLLFTFARLCSVPLFFHLWSVSCQQII